MIRTAHPVAGDVLPEALVSDAARCWRAARDAGRPVQPELHAILAPRGWEMLAPVIDSLLTLCEYRINRALSFGAPNESSADVGLLCRLLDQGGDSALDAPDPRGIDGAFRTAVESARLMVKAALSAVVAKRLHIMA